MKIVIEIPEEIRLLLINNQESSLNLDQKSIMESCIKSAIINGIPLPKGHGNLIQREDAEAIFKNARKALYEQSRKEPIKDLPTRDFMLLNAEQFVHMIEPIIEADKEGEEWRELMNKEVNE